MQEEMSQHLERATERLMARGMSPDEAQRAALREFGNVAYLQEKGRDARGGRWLEALTPDAKLALRMLVKNPVLSVVGGLGMAVAITITTGFFTFMTFYYSDPPLEDGDRIVTVEYIKGDFSQSTFFDYDIWKNELETVEELAAYKSAWRDLESVIASPSRVKIAEMTASGFRVARVPPLLGRPLLDSDEIEGAPRVVVIGYREWQQRFGASPGVVGEELRLDGTVHTIIGVMPEGFLFPANHGFWTTLETRIGLDGPGEGVKAVFGRLAPGVETTAAEAELGAILERVTALYPQIYQRYQPAVQPFIRHLLDVQQYPAWSIWLMQLFAWLILAVVAVNVAVLVYARTALRRGEITVRTALGASRSRIVSQLFLEALALSTVAAALGLLMAQIGFRQMTALIDPQANLPYWLLGNLPAETILYAAGLAVVAAFVVGVLPALQATGGRLESTLRELGGGSGLQMGKTWTVLICVQVAIAVGILPAVLGVAWNYSPQPTPNFDATEILLLRLQPESGASADIYSGQQEPGTDQRRVQVELLRRIEAIPGVVDVTFASSLPSRGESVRVQVADAASAPSLSPFATASHRVDVDYFDAFGIVLLTGRRFGRGDIEAGVAAAIVNRSFVEHYLGGGAPLGRRFRELAAENTAPDGTEPWFEVVGVVEDMLSPSGRGRPLPATYHPMPVSGEALILTAHTRGIDPASIAPRIRRIAEDVAPGYDLTTSSMDAVYDGGRGELRFIVILVGLITLSVVLLAAAGISAMMSLAVTRRRREIAIRTALGASRRQVVTSILATSTQQLAVGLLMGAAGAALLDGLTRGAMLGGQMATLLALVATIMLVSGLLATLAPVTRALRIRPMEALREE